MDNLLGLAIVIVALWAYFLPWMVAAGRGHHQQLAIFVTCLLLGWTGLGWIIALIWACTAVRAGTTI
jgi:Superinfection immunity protein